MPFTSDFVNVRTRDGHNVILLDPLVYVTKAGEEITVPRGAQSDGASTPAVLWSSIPPFGEHWKPALLHDFLYRNTKRPKDECDRIFLDAMCECGVPGTECLAIYEGVRLCGLPAFDEDRKEK